MKRQEQNIEKLVSAFGNISDDNINIDYDKIIKKSKRRMPSFEYISIAACMVIIFESIVVSLLSISAIALIGEKYNQISTETDSEQCAETMQTVKQKYEEKYTQIRNEFVAAGKYLKATQNEFFNSDYAANLNALGLTNEEFLERFKSDFVSVPLHEIPGVTAVSDFEQHQMDILNVPSELSLYSGKFSMSNIYSFNISMGVHHIDFIDSNSFVTAHKIVNPEFECYLYVRFEGYETSTSFAFPFAPTYPTYFTFDEPLSISDFSEIKIGSTLDDFSEISNYLGKESIWMNGGKDTKILEINFICSDGIFHAERDIYSGVVTGTEVKTMEECGLVGIELPW